MHRSPERYSMSRLLFVATIVALASCYANAQSTQTPGPVPTPPDADDPPARVGRLALIEGAVSFRPAAGDTWAIPDPNRPVTTGDALWVDTMGHAEVQVGANALRASRETEVDFVHLDDDMFQVRVPQGSIDLRIKQIGIKQDYEVDAPNAAIALDQEGEYRIDVSADGDTTRVTTWSGQAQVTAAGSTFPVEAGHTAVVRGDSAPTYDLAEAGASDAFDRWARARNEREDRVSAASQYVPPDVSGIEDLDDYGTWVAGPDYCGSVWFPTTVAVGWAPYSAGSWIWVDPWGWTWVDAYAWGWAPFHYGRWAYINSAWGWCPGPLAPPLVYESWWAPGLVAWWGGPTWGPGIGWFPLGPREPFFPWYRTGLRYRERINPGIRDVTNVTTISYRNRTVPGAVTAVSPRVLGNGEPVGRAAVHPSPSELGAGGALGRPGIAPTSRSLIGVRGAGPAAAPPARLATRSVAALHAPPPAPVRFSAEERALAANGGRPLTQSERVVLRSNPAARGVERPMHSAATPLGSGRGLAPARPGLTPARPAPGLRARPGRTALDQSFGDERQQLESRHIQEFAKPPAGESREEMYQRQETEHRDLISRYNTARSAGAARMPAPSHGGGHH